MSVFVAGKDVYVGGSQSLGGKAVAKYWKNNVEVVLSDAFAGASIPQSIYVSGNDVFLCCNDYLNGKTKAVYWKNGTKLSVTDGTTESWATSIEVFDGDIYISGQDDTHGTSSPYAFKSAAVYWKNGSKIYLTDANNNSTATGISIQ